MVLVHGNAAPYVSWDNTIEDLVGAGLRVLRYDLIGHGFTDRPRLRAYDRALYITQLAELIDRLDIPYPVSVPLRFAEPGCDSAVRFSAVSPREIRRSGQ